MSKKVFKNNAHAVFKTTAQPVKVHKRTASPDEGKGVRVLLGEEEPQQKRPGRPRMNKTVTRANQLGTKEGETRYNVILKEDSLEKIKAIAYHEKGGKIKDAFNEAVELFIKKYKAKLRPRPLEVRKAEAEGFKKSKYARGMANEVRTPQY